MGTGNGLLVIDTENGQEFNIRLDVDLNNLTEEQKEEIRTQITELLEDLGATTVEFEDFQEGSTVVPFKITSAHLITVNDISSSIGKAESTKKISLKTDDENIFETVIYLSVSKKDEETKEEINEEIKYETDVTFIKKDKTRITKTIDGNGTEVTTALFSGFVIDDIECIIFGGKSQSIGTYAFRNFTNLKKIKFGPVKITNTGSFMQLANLSSIIFDSVEEIKNSSFLKCSGITSINLENVKTLEKQAFEDCTSLKDVDFGSVTSIVGNETFQNCTSLEEIDLKNITTIEGPSTFKGCTKLTKLNLGSLTNISDARAFEGCKNLSEVKLNNINQDITFPNYSFSGTLVAEDSVDYPFLVSEDFSHNIGFQSANGNFAWKSISNSTLNLVYYSQEEGYKRLTKVTN